jgi:putative ABC transport system ATP-binding protein
MINIQKKYNDLEVLKGINLKVKTGEFISIMGPSGSGKSTLLGISAGLDSPDSGEVIIDSFSLQKLSQDELARMRAERIGFIFQNFQLVKTLRAWENVCLPLLFSKKNDSDAKDKAIELLNSVGLKDRVNHFPSQLSGGEEQRVAIARAFINQPKLLFADEPTGNLDTKNGDLIMEKLKTLQKKNGATLLVVTHDPKVAKLSDRIIEMQDGNIYTPKIKSKVKK